MATYRGEVQKGHGMTLGDTVDIVEGWRGVVKLGDRTVTWGNLMRSQSAAHAWAVKEAKRYRDYRQQNGEGIEEVHARKQQADRAASRRRGRMTDKRQDMYDLLVGFLSDLELIEDLPNQTAARIAKAKEVLAYIDTPNKDS